MLDELHRRSKDLGVPPEVLVSNDVLEAYKALVEYAGWVHKHWQEASDESRGFRRGTVRVIAAKLEEYAATLRTLEAERYDA